MVRSIAKKRHKVREDRYNEYLRAVSSLKGPAPTNPFKWLRLNANLTIQDVCEATGISKQALIRLEQGTYSDPIDRVVTFWVTNGSRYNQVTDYVDLMRRYENFKTVTRKRHARIFGDMPLRAEFNTELTKHPFTALRSMWTNPETLDVLGVMNITECSKLLCIPQSVLDHFNNKVVRQQSVPKPLINALHENGYTTAEIIRFEQAYEDYRAFMVNGVTPAETDAAKVTTLPVGFSEDFLRQALNG